MSVGLPLLAASGEDPTVKIVIGAVVAVIWVLSQIFGAMTKKPDQSLPPSRPRPRPQPTVAPPTPMQQRTQMQPADVTQQARQRPPQLRQPSQQVPKQPARRQPPVRRQAVQPAVAPPSTHRQPATARSTEVVPPAAAKGMPQRDMIDALLKPRNLRKAYVLTELLRPPVALRPSQDRSGEPG